MDIALHYADEYFFDPYVYPVDWPRENYWRQFLSLNLICDLGGALLYLITASLSWVFIFDARLLKHKLALEVVHYIYIDDIYKIVYFLKYDFRRKDFDKLMLIL